MLSHIGDLDVSHVSCSLNSDLPDDAALVTVVPLHVEVTVVSDGEDVGRHFTDLLVGVEADLVGRVDGQHLVRVDSHQDGAGVGLHTEEEEFNLFNVMLSMNLMSE